MARKTGLEHSMNLHEDKDAFLELVQATAQKAKLPEIYVEKDYWVTNVLRNLASSDLSHTVVFKGGTSLSKAHKLVERFSEDIDLAVIDLSQSGNQKRGLLKNIETVAAKGLTQIKDDLRISKRSRIRKTVWRYPRVVNDQNFGQASSNLLIEVAAFVEPQPNMVMTLESIIAEELSNLGRNDLIDLHGLESFEINVLAVERTLTEKILCLAMKSYDQDPISRLSTGIRHLYDINKILKQGKFRDFILGQEFPVLLDACLVQEADCFGKKEWHDHPLGHAPIFAKIDEWAPSLKAAYTGEFEDMVYGDLPGFGGVVDSVKLIRDSLRPC
jgi:predicted nucleotidyltransferase component of viral defense system